MQAILDTSEIIRNCENAVHEAFKNHGNDLPTLSNNIGGLCSEFGDDVVRTAMVNCMRVAYLRNSFSS